MSARRRGPTAGGRGRRGRGACVELEPPEPAGPGWAASRDAHKMEQLCRQVERRLTLALGELSDPVLQDVRLEDVVPDPAGGLLVVVARPDDDGPDPLTMLERLSVVRGRLRSEVAAAIHRKKTPRLSFCLAAEREEDREERTMARG